MTFMTNEVRTKTIDNLGIGASNVYAEAQENLKNIRWIEEARLLGQQAEVLTLAPTFLSEYETKFGLRRTILWAAFPGEPAFPLFMLFGITLIPALGTDDEQQNVLDEMTALADTLPPDALVQQEYKKILALLRLIHELDRTLERVNAERMRYHKG
jgi:hypothetical protein